MIEPVLTGNSPKLCNSSQQTYQNILKDRKIHFGTDVILRLRSSYYFCRVLEANIFGRHDRVLGSDLGFKQNELQLESFAGAFRMMP